MTFAEKTVQRSDVLDVPVEVLEELTHALAQTPARGELLRNLTPHLAPDEANTGDPHLKDSNED